MSEPAFAQSSTSDPLGDQEIGTLTLHTGQPTDLPILVSVTYEANGVISQAEGVIGGVREVGLVTHFSAFDEEGVDVTSAQLRTRVATRLDDDGQPFQGPQGKIAFLTPVDLTASPARLSARTARR
ncbi:MAG: hypothetical protein AB7N76_30935 [Planctomycetota bacterium]